MTETSTIPKDARIYVAGHTGLVGSALMRALTKAGYTSILTRTRSELDLTDQQAVRAFFGQERPSYVYLAAAKVGGILANREEPAEFIYENLAIETNVIRAAYETNVEKLLFLGSSCIYPRDAAQPMKEECLLTGPLEETNRPYAIAKIAGLELCRSYRKEYGKRFICVMPTNLYGPYDTFDAENGHVIPGLMRRFDEAKTVGAPETSVWGTGTPKREFLHVDDLADACLFLMERYDGEGIVNIGTGEEISVRALAEEMKSVVGYTGAIAWDTTKPDGTPRKLLDVGKLHALGWKHRIGLTEGLRDTYAWYQKHRG